MNRDAFALNKQTRFDKSRNTISKDHFTLFMVLFEIKLINLISSFSCVQQNYIAVFLLSVDYDKFFSSMIIANGEEKT